MTTNDPMIETRTFDGESFEVALRPGKSQEKLSDRYPPPAPGSSVSGGIRIDRDVAVRMRDGVTIYTDIYRPDGATDVPALVAWSPYGKRVGYAEPLLVPGVPPGTLSPGAKFEGPDPDYWCRRGYAVVNPDARGVGYSEGILQLWTRQEAQDTADLIEWLAVQEWCNGRVGMSGNSWLAMAQWGAAAERPPHLACIAPWEGSTDPYRQLFCVGGIPQVGFREVLDNALAGNGLAEDFVTNAERHPFYDAYWREKVVDDLERIEIPAFISAGWSHFHLWGTIEAFRRIGSQAKWLRIHREFEWPDAYAPQNLEDLGRFFDRYLKGHHNGWELTPRVRIDVMDRGDREHVSNRAETSFPLPDTTYRKLFLDSATASLVDTAPAVEAETTYDACSGTAVFEMTFDRDTELTGYFKLRLWVEARGGDDLDLFVAIQKADRAGNFIPTLVVGRPHPGAPGILRVSHRELDTAISTESEPVHRHTSEQRLRPGEIVPVDIPIWPTSRLWRAEERLRITISGHHERDADWWEHFSWDLRNQGMHVIHTGGSFDTHLLVPEIPDPRPVIPGLSITSDKLVPFWTYTEPEDAD